MTFNQKTSVASLIVSTILSLASLGLAIVAFVVAQQSNETGKAISGLTEIARQITRQADGVNQQLVEMRRQTSALAGQATAAQGQLENSRTQTRAISEQTDAIKGTSAAAIQSSNAQREGAVVMARAQLPRPSLDTMSIEKFESATLKIKPGETAYSLKLRFSNTGGGAFVQKPSTFGIYITDKMLARPNERELSSWGTNNYGVGPGKSLEFNHSPILMLTDGQIAALRAHEKSAFVIGTLNYEDSLSRRYSYCWAYKLQWSDDGLRDPFPITLQGFDCPD